jgi:hypothetical protein
VEGAYGPEFTRQYWLGTTVKCGWKKGSPWKLVYANGTTTDTGKILEIDPPRRRVIQWQNEFRPELKEEGPSRCTFELDPKGTCLRTRPRRFPNTAAVFRSILDVSAGLVQEESGARPVQRS